MQDKTGGYCPMCDTVWALPGKCRCEPSSEMNAVIDAAFIEVWNAAIEAAASVSEINSAADIRKLKR